MRLNYGDIYVEITKSNIHIHNSYKLTSKTDKQAMLNEIFNIVPKFPRSYKSALREWRAHNVLYKFHLFRKSTMHTDIEAKPGLFHRICYFLLSLLDFGK